MAKQKLIQEFLDSTLELNRYYNFLLLPFDYVEFMKNPIIQDQILQIHKTEARDREMEKTSYRRFSILSFIN